MDWQDRSLNRLRSVREWLAKDREAGWSAVDYGPDGLYGVSVLAPASPGGKPKVAKHGALPGAGLDAEALSGLAKQISVAGCPWTLPLNRRDCNMLVIQEPPVLPAEMEQSIRWSIGTMLNYPVDEANVAWMKIPTAQSMPNRPPSLYVIAARSDLVARYQEIFREARIPLQAIDVRGTAQRNIAALAEAPGEGLGLLLAGSQGVQFTVTYNGELYLDRFVEESLFEGSVLGTDGQKRAMERIALQVQRSLDFLSRTMSFINIGRVLVAPTPAKIGLSDYLAQNLAVPMEALDLASLFDFSPTPELAEPENQALYFTALGAALRFMKTAA